MSRGAMRQTISVLLNEELLSLNRAVGVLRRCNLAVESIAVGPSQAPGVSRLTIILNGDEPTVDRMVKQLRKTDGVEQAVAFRCHDGVARELALIKVRAPQAHYAELLDAVSLFNASVLDEGAEEIIVEVAGSGPFILSLIRALEPFGVLDIARSGSIALERAGAAYELAADEPG